MGKSNNMMKTLRPPSRVDALPFPVFGLTWYGSATMTTTTSHDSGGGGGGGGCSVIAYCGGGGSAKTGVGNKIVVLVTITTNTTSASHNDTDNDKDDGIIIGNTSTMTRQIEISTGDALCFGVHAFCPPKDHSNNDNSINQDNSDMVRLLACVGDEILLYGIPLVAVQQQPHAEEDDDVNRNDTKKKNDAIMLCRYNVGNSYGASVASYSTLLCRTNPGTLIHCVAVGCENGRIVIFNINQTSSNRSTIAASTTTTTPATTTTATDRRIYDYEFVKVCECIGHTKAICALSFHPRGGAHQLLTSAKDGTARIFNIDDGSEMGVLACEVHDPKLAPPSQTPVAAGTSSSTTTTDPRMMKRPPQILVRGCAYGDLEGNIIYTVASGKRGPAYLTKWTTVSTPASSSCDETRPLSIKQDYRIQCSPVPISATSLSYDGNLLTMGSVEGSILIYNLSTCKLQKEFSMIHDLPVTCVASRPIPNSLFLPGEWEEGVNFDAISASADNRLGRWTLQSQSRKVHGVSGSNSSRRRSRSSGRRNNPVISFFVDYFVRVPIMLIMVLLMMAIWDATGVCRSEFRLSALFGDEGMAMAGRCFYREVLWAEESRVSFVPH